MMDARRIVFAITFAAKEHRIACTAVFPLDLPVSYISEVQVGRGVGWLTCTSTSSHWRNTYSV
jgi:hypothetical protein